MICGLNKRFQSRLLSHRDGDGGGGCKDEFGDYLDRYQTRGVLLQLISQCAIQ
jgi:hypothetical protein